MSDEKITLLVKIQVKDHEREKFSSLVSHISSFVQEKEKGKTINYEFYYGTQREIIFVVESYANSEALLNHMKMIGENFPDFTSLFSVISTSICGQCSDEARNALAGLAGTQDWYPSSEKYK